MPALRRSWLLLIAAALVLVSVLATWVVVGSSSSGTATSSGTGYIPGGAVAAGRGAAASTKGVASTSGAYAPWCCSSGGNAPGLTITGQAAVYGYGPQARASAIAQAVADAQDQARATASAAGFSLNGIIDMQVSGPSYYAYPMEGAAGAPTGAPRGALPPTPAAGAGTGTGGAPAAPPVTAAPAAPRSSGSSGSSSAKSGSSFACVYGAPCPYDGYTTSVTVTITWAIA